MRTDTAADHWHFQPLFAVLALALAGLFADRVLAAPSLESAYSMLEWRDVGPNRGGRSIAAAGHADRPFEYYFGAVGGGLWKTEDGGTRWRPVTDGKIGSASVGAVAVAPSNPDIVYLGMGEGQLRSNVMQGDGIYRSVDAGKSWTHLGLAATRTITALRVHPKNPDIIYAAALGDPFADNVDRGVFRSRDGGKTWMKVLYRSAKAGAIDLVMDPNDPDTLYATLWQVYRKPWKLWSGGPGSGLFKSTDGGDSWTEITRNPGLPAGVLGKMTITVAPADSRRLYANIEAADGGLYRSDDAGQSWTHINGDRKLWQRSFYFMRLRPDPANRDTLYVLSFKLEKSTDGGKTFAEVRTRHADVHDLWIDPANPGRMIVADDGGGSVSVNGGTSWTEQDFPTAQIYRLATTRGFPYKLCGAQQDNSTVCVPSRSEARGGQPHVDSFADFEVIAGSESGYVAPHPADENILFVGETNGLVRVDTARGVERDVQPYPYAVMGQPASTMKERWNWTYPIMFSEIAPHPLFIGSQHLWRSTDQGLNWAKISPDLTRADPATLGETGGPIRPDQDGPEVYATIFTIAPSPRDPGLIWTGSDDGLVHITRDAGKSWQAVTPRGLPQPARISFIHASDHDAGTAYLAAKRHELGDRRPWLFRTTDHGASWTRIDTGLPAEAFTHAIVEDKHHKGLLFAGTEHGVAVSFDNGGSWHSLSLNLPDTHVSGLKVVGNELAISTHGRSFHVLEGLETLRHLAAEGPPAAATLFTPAQAVLGAIPARLDFYLDRPADAARMTVTDESGTIVRRLALPPRLETGAHSVQWNLRHDGATVFPNMILEAPNPATGPTVLPGTYKVAIDLGDRQLTRSLVVAADPRHGTADMGALAAQHDLALALRDAISAANQAVIDIRALRETLESRQLDGALARSRAQIVEAIGAVEATLYQVRNQSPKDKIAYPIQLNDRLAHLMALVGTNGGAPTAGQRQVYADLRVELDAALGRYKAVLSDDLPRFNRALAAAGVAPVDARR
ncbi:MAG: glycosyl hydrolase [Alphaproteobacteria bacterium]|nr:MAG: glycosyl hydrolase [Alphaproteobacteria bacterium]